MIEILTQQLPYHRIEIFETESKLLSHHFSDCDSTFCMFFSTENDSLISAIEKHKEDIETILKDIPFINLNKEVWNKGQVEKVISYYLPYFTKKNLSLFKENKAEDDFFSLLDSINIDKPLPNEQNIYSDALTSMGYKGNIKSGIIFFDGYKNYVIECNGIEDIKFIILQTKKAHDSIVDFTLYARPNIFDNYINENLEEETLNIINDFKNKLKNLKNSGQLFLTLPILEQIIEEEFININSQELSPISISISHEIILPKFNLLEVSLSHLTKVVYIFFCKHPNGIDISYLHEYKDELMDLYLAISNQINYDKMLISIQDLINPSSKSIYTHFSRIKSTFYQLMNKDYAKYYTINKYNDTSIYYIPIVNLLPVGECF